MPPKVQDTPPAGWTGQFAVLTQEDPSSDDLQASSGWTDLLAEEQEQDNTEGGSCLLCSSSRLQTESIGPMTSHD